MGLLVFAFACGCGAEDEAPPKEATGARVEAITSQEFVWRHGDPSVRMKSTNDGFCYLVGISGRFDAEAQRARLHVDNGFWLLDGDDPQANPTNQMTLRARCNDWRDFSDGAQFSWSGQSEAWMHIDCQWDGGFGCTDQTYTNSPIDLWDSRSFCFLSGMAGNFAGAGERVEVVRAWQLQATSHDDLTSEATKGDGRCVWFGNTYENRLRISDEHWLSQGSSNVDLIPIDAGICAITGVTGQFAGAGEAVTILPNLVTRKWQMHVESQQTGVGFKATCIPFDQGLRTPPPPPPPPTFPMPSCTISSLWCGGYVYVSCRTLPVTQVLEQKTSSGYVRIASAAANADASFTTQSPQSPATYRVCAPNWCTPDLTTVVHPEPCPPPPPPPPPPPRCPVGTHWCGEDQGCVRNRILCQ